MPPLEEIRSAPTRWLFSYQVAAGRKLYSRRRQNKSLRCGILDSLTRSRRILVDYAVLPREIHLHHRGCRRGEGDGGGEGNRPRDRAQGQSGRRRDEPGIATAYRAHRIASLSALREEMSMLARRPVALDCARHPRATRCPACVRRLGSPRRMDSMQLLVAFLTDYECATSLPH